MLLDLWVDYLLINWSGPVPHVHPCMASSECAWCKCYAFVVHCTLCVHCSCRHMYTYVYVYVSWHMFMCMYMYSLYIHLISITSAVCATYNNIIVSPVCPLTSVSLSLLVKCCVPKMKWQALLLFSVTYIIMTTILKGTYVECTEYVHVPHIQSYHTVSEFIGMQATNLQIALCRATIDFYHSIQSRIIPSKCKLKVSLFSCLAC